MNKKTFSSGEVAKICGVTLRTVLNWIAKGWLQAYQLPGTRKDNRITSEHLLVFMKEHQMPIPEELAVVNRRVLVVDDEIAMAKSIGRILRQKGFDVNYAHDGFSAGQMYEKMQPTLITLDLQMPGLNGFEVLEKMEKTKLVKIIVISGLDRKALNSTLNIGADAVLEKPFEITELESIIDKLVI